MNAIRSISLIAVLATVALCACADDTMELSADAMMTPPAGADAEVDAAAPPDAMVHVYGEFCLHDDDCESKTCYLQTCSRPCAADLANDCRAESAFCIPAAGVVSATDVCYGHVESGDDVDDDALLALDEERTAKLSPVGDADLFQLTLPAGTYSAKAQPDADLDVRVEIYNEMTKNDASADAGGKGVAEEAIFVVRHDGERFFVVARSVTGSGNAVVHVTKRAN